VDELPQVEVAVKALDFLGGELHDSRSYGIEGVIVADADVPAWVPLGAALADDDIPDAGSLAAENLDAQTLGAGISAKGGGATGFFVCHCSALFRNFVFTLLRASITRFRLIRAVLIPGLLALPLPRTGK